ncbi:unnamed protein product [Somion occarium]|uniref:Uncharacterized protein n=1 Tax=Somion occarium TaxID=3059160 RepID=A0ABP1DR36_9APHY
MVFKLGPAVKAMSDVLQREHIPVILWGELAMEQYKIPTAIIRFDVLVPDDMLTRAAEAFETEGWRASTGPLPRALAGFWQPGWDVVGKACRRYHFPPGLVPDDIILLILPTSFVGLGPSPSLDSEEYTQIISWGDEYLPNVYLPSSHLMAITIARTDIRHTVKRSGLSSLLRAWASYFYIYCDFHVGSLDDAEQDVQDFWRSLMVAQCRDKEN